jgi:catechol 2,3-dioxygenase-like lactoylglutathione lyase family enzyme
MPSWSIDHISAVTLPVVSMAASVAFYRKLGFEVTYGGPTAAFTTMRAGDAAVVNLSRAEAGSARCGHRVILRVRGVDALHRELVERGLPPSTPRDAEWGERYCELHDPDSVVISFAEPIA